MGELNNNANNDNRNDMSHEDSEELLRCLSRLSFVGMGQSKELDTSLSELRRAIKRNSNLAAIKKHVDKVSKALINHEDKRSSLSSNEISADLELLEQLLSRPLPKEFKKALKKLERERENQEAAQIISSIVDHIESFINQSPGKTGKGLFGKLFSRNDKNNETKLEDTIAAVRADDVPEALKSTLMHLIEQLSAIENNQALAESLSKKVEELTRTEQLIEILEAVTGAFVDFAGHEHAQFEKFLKSLSQRIDRVNAFILETTKFNQSFSENSEMLDADLKSSVSSLKESIEAKDNLGEIKLMLSEKMDAIVLRVNEFCESQQKNHQQLTSNCEQLREQLNATQDETSRLKDELAAQRVRAQTDPLTGLPNRYSYNDRLTQEYNRWRRYRSPLSLVVGDIDWFKQVNDNYGHVVGDKVLKQISNYLSSELRESDFIARYGGEEFVMLLPETNLVDATKAMNKLRQGIKEIQVKAESEAISVSMSFGIAEFENNDTAKAVFARADKALYRAKDKGRDQVCCQRAKPVKE